MDLIARAARLPHASETLLGDEFQTIPGGKGANQAVAARRVGASTVLIGSVGADPFGDELMAFLGGEDLDLQVVRQQASTGVALILVGGLGENIIVVVAGANHRNQIDQVNRVELTNKDVVLVQGEIPDEVTRSLLVRANAHGSTSVLNLSPVRPGLLDLVSDVDYLIVNEVEFAQVLGVGAVNTVEHVGTLLMDGNDHFQNVVVTLGRLGLVARVRDGLYAMPAHPVKSVDTTGAGDCFCGTFAAMLALGRSPLAALEFANAAAALSVRSMGAAASMPRHDDVTQLLDTTERDLQAPDAP